MTRLQLSAAAAAACVALASSQPVPEAEKVKNVVQDPRFSSVATVAGSGMEAIGIAALDDGQGAGAAFTALRGLGGGPSDCDDGVVYVVDQKISKIREVSWGGLTGTLGGIDDLAGAANGCGGNSTFRAPHAVASAGPYLFIADTSNNCVRRMNKNDQCVITLAGPCVSTEAKEAGDSEKAQFGKPRGIAAHQADDGTISVYMTDEGNDRVVRIDGESGEVTTISENPENPEAISSDGSFINANIWKLPRGLAITPDGLTLIVADDGLNQLFTIDLTPSANYSRAWLAGQNWPENGSVNATYIDGPPAVARFNRPRGVCADGTHAFVADFMNNAFRSVDLKTGEVKTVFGGSSGTDCPTCPSLEGFPPDYNPDIKAADGPVANATADNPTACVVFSTTVCGDNATLPGSPVSLFVGDDFSYRVRVVT
jgi:hypothetical protein